MRSEQPGLFDVPEPRARRTDVETSHAAAKSMVSGARAHRQMIYDALVEHGPMTGDELCEYFGWKHATANRRLPELEERGLVQKLGERRKTRSGRMARLWAAIR